MSASGSDPYTSGSFSGFDIPGHAPRTFAPDYEKPVRSGSDQSLKSPAEPIVRTICETHMDTQPVPKPTTIHRNPYEMYYGQQFYHGYGYGFQNHAYAHHGYGYGYHHQNPNFPQHQVRIMVPASSNDWCVIHMNLTFRGGFRLQFIAFSIEFNNSGNHRSNYQLKIQLLTYQNAMSPIDRLNFFRGLQIVRKQIFGRRIWKKPTEMNREANLDLIRLLTLMPIKETHKNPSLTPWVVLSLIKKT